VLLDLEKSGPQDELRPAVEELCDMVVPQLWYQIDRLRGEVDAARARRASVELSQRLALEDRIGDITQFLNQVYSGAQAHFTEMERLGLDVSAAADSFKVELAERADELSGRLDLALARIDDLEDRHSKTPEDGDIPALMAAALESRDLNAASLKLILDFMDEYELHTEDYRTQLVTATRDISVGILDTDVAASLISRAVNRITGWLSSTGPQFAVKLVLFLAILLGFRFVSRVVRRATEKVLDRSNLNVSKLLRRMILTTVSNMVLLLGLLIALSQLGVSLGPLMAGIGVAGFILGFALQDTLSNFASGLMILLYRPYDVGDMVEVSGAFGKVDRMSLVSTTILTIDNQSLVIPNNKIWGDVIKNVTDQDMRRIDMVFVDILRAHERILKDPEPEVHLHTLNESSVDFVVRPWVRTEDYWTVYWDVTRAVKIRFDEEGVSIPFPQRDVHLYQQTTSDKTTT
jgi:small conductance mechanosensitive channel